MMDPSKAWTKMFSLYTDGQNVWAMHGDTLLGTVSIGQGLDGPAVALASAAAEVARDAVATSACAALAVTR